MPQYIMLDTILETFKCLTPHPVLKRGDPSLAGKVGGPGLLPRFLGCRHAAGRVPCCHILTHVRVPACRALC